MDLPLINTKSIIKSTISNVKLSEIPLTTRTKNVNNVEYNRISGYVDEDLNSMIINTLS